MFRMRTHHSPESADKEIIIRDGPPLPVASEAREEACGQNNLNKGQEHIKATTKGLSKLTLHGFAERDCL